ncbi:MAG: HD-GYP domain-containing protein [Bacillus sp. (in: firmicutes)]
MRLLEVKQVKVNQVLGRTIYNERNQVLLGEGVVLTEKLLQRLEDLGISFIYVQDEHIVPESTITDQLRRTTIQSMEKLFKNIGESKELASTYFLMDRASKDFKALIRYISDEIKKSEELLTIMTDVYILDSYIFTHSLNVTLYSLAIGLELKLEQKQLEILGLGAMLHDVGKLNVSKDILNKPGKLTDDEYKEIKEHAENGFRILKDVSTLPLLVAHCAYQHHERLDGSGYPRGINGQDIHLFGKIIAVADVFDAVTSNRVYRRAMLPHEGLEILYAGSGTLFDQSIIEAFRKSVAIYPIGLTVTLSDYRIGVVSKQNHGSSDRPFVHIIRERDQVLSESYELNLLDHLDITIIGCHKEDSNDWSFAN